MQQILIFSLCHSNQIADLNPWYYRNSEAATDTCLNYILLQDDSFYLQVL